MLLHHFVKKYAAQYRIPTQTLCNDAIEQLLAYPWPGNIRELENIIQQAMVMSTGDVIRTRDLRLPESRSKIVSGSFESFESFEKTRKELIDAFERNYLIRLLTKFNGNIVSAATCAGKSRTGLWNLLARHHLHPRQFNGKPG